MKSLIFVCIFVILCTGLRVDLTETFLKAKRETDIDMAIQQNKIKTISPEELQMIKEGTLSVINYNTSKFDSDNPTVDLINFKNVQYYGPAVVGSEEQKFLVVYDTGSSWFWIPKDNCDGCFGQGNRFSTVSSSTYINTQERITLNYGKGTAEGYISTDLIGLENSTPGRMTFIPVDVASDMEGSQADGIAGLAPTPSQGADLFVDMLVDTNVIDTREFTVFIGQSGTDESFIEFGRNQDDQVNVTFVDLTPFEGQPQTYWSVILDSLTYGDTVLTLDTYNTVWDTGTSLIGFTRTNLLNIVTTIANEQKLFVIEGTYYAIECDDIDRVENMYFEFDEKTITVDKNEFVQYSQGYCIFIMFEIPNGVSSQDFTLLGDSFLRGVKTIHDIENMRIGIFPQKMYEYNGSGGGSLLWIYIVMAIVGIAIIILGLVCIFKYLKNYKRTGTNQTTYQRVK